MLSGIVAMTRQGKVMGKNNALPWHLPDDLKFFKETTLGYRLVMGRKTFESIGSKPLPKRENWVLSRSKLALPGVRVFHSREDILKEVERLGNSQKTFVIGGAQLFEIFWGDIHELLVTWIDQAFDGDIKFPALNWSGFELLQEHKVADPFPHSFARYEKRQRDRFLSP